MREARNPDRGASWLEDTTGRGVTLHGSILQLIMMKATRFGTMGVADAWAGGRTDTR